MSDPTFHTFGEDGAHFYSLARCDGFYHQRSGATPAQMLLYVGTSSQFSRFSLQAFGSDGQELLYHRGPDYTSNVEAALLDALAKLAIPVYAWRLYPHESIGPFEHPQHEAIYSAARIELCRALYWVGGRSALPPGFEEPPPLFTISDAAKTPPYLLAGDDESNELLQAAGEDWPLGSLKE